MVIYFEKYEEIVENESLNSFWSSAEFDYKLISSTKENYTFTLLIVDLNISEFFLYFDYMFLEIEPIKVLVKKDFFRQNYRTQKPTSECQWVASHSYQYSTKIPVKHSNEPKKIVVRSFNRYFQTHTENVRAVETQLILISNIATEVTRLSTACWFL